jgi:hypothetical protein
MRKLLAIVLIELLALPAFPQGTITATGSVVATGGVNFTGSTAALCTITTTSLPNATVGSPYVPQALMSTNCVSPNWIVLSGALPLGMNMTTGGVISGTPTAVGSATFTVEISNAANLPTKFLSITVNSTTGPSNPYCGAGDVPNFGGGGVDTVATLPIACTNTALVNTPASGPVKTVCASGCDFSTINAATTSAVCGWIIKIKSTSDGTPSGAQQSYAPFTVSNACTAANWIWIETDQVAGIPIEGARISPGFMGIPSLHLACPLPETSPEVTECGRPPYSEPAVAGVYVPKIVGSGNKVITVNAGAKFIRFIGLEVTNAFGTTVNGDMIQATGTDHIIFDRIIGHGGNSSTWQSTTDAKTFLDFGQSTHWALIQSYIGDMHIVGTGSNVFSMGGCSTGTEGPGTVKGNFLESADSSSAAGGCGSGVSTLPVQDVEITGNHFWKPMFWKTNDTSYFGTQFGVKNHLDWKNINRVLIEGNIGDHVWGQQSDQFGAPINFGAKSQSVKTFGTANASSNNVTAVTGAFPANMTDPHCATPNECIIQLNGISYLVVAQTDTTHVTTSVPVGTLTGAVFTACGVGQNPVAQVTNITFRYNKFQHGSRGPEIFSVTSDCNDSAGSTGKISMHDNVFDDINGAWNLTSGAGPAWGFALELLNTQASPNNVDLININHNTMLSRITNFASLGYGPSTGAGEQTAVGASIGHLTITNNIFASGIEPAAKGVCVYSSFPSAKLLFDCWTPSAQLCVDHNGIATTTATSGSTVTTLNNTPYPDVTDNLGCGFTAVGQFFQPSYDLIQFTNLNAANGGNYQLQPTSPYHNAGSDGKDLGADITLVNSFTNGVN